MAIPAFQAQRESLTAALARIIERTGLEPAKAEAQMRRAITERQLRIWFPTVTGVAERVNPSTVDIHASTIWCKPHGSGWSEFEGRAVPIEVEIAQIDQLWPVNVTTASEARATQHLVELLRAHKDIAKQQAFAACQPFRVTQRGFDDRVWPEARRLAQVGPARAGRKKSPHKSEH